MRGSCVMGRTEKWAAGSWDQRGNWRTCKGVGGDGRGAWDVPSLLLRFPARANLLRQWDPPMPNSFGKLFTVTTWGESHGPAVGVVVDGCPPRLPLAAEEIQAELDRRRPGQSDIVTPRRKEKDAVEILAGVFEGRTTGAPISLLVRSDRRAARGLRRDAGEIPPFARRLHLPGEIRHPRPPGRRPQLGPRDDRPRGRRRDREEDPGPGGRGGDPRLCPAGPRYRAPPDAWSTFRRSRPKSRLRRSAARTRRRPRADGRAHQGGAGDGDSVGGVIQCRVRGVPPGLGEPVFDRLEADLAKAMLSLPRQGLRDRQRLRRHVLKGSEHNDAFVIARAASAPRPTAPAASRAASATARRST